MSLAVFFLHSIIVLHHIHKKVPPVDEIWSKFPMNTPVLLYTDIVFFFIIFLYARTTQSPGIL